MKQIIIPTLLAFLAILLLPPPASRAQTPAISEEARKHFVMGTTLYKDAKTQADFAEAAAEYLQAANFAPEWREARNNTAAMFEAAGDYANALTNLKLYQQFKLPDDEARAVQDKIYALEAKQRKAARDNVQAVNKRVEERRVQQEDAEAKKATEQEDFLKKINGARYVYRWVSNPDADEEGYSTLDVNGDTVTWGAVVTRTRFIARQEGVGKWRPSGESFKIVGRTLRAKAAVSQGDTGVITEDGNTIAITRRLGDGRVLVFKRER